MMSFQVDGHAVRMQHAVQPVGNLLADVTGKNLPAYAHDFSAFVAALEKASEMSREFPLVLGWLGLALGLGEQARAQAQEHSAERQILDKIPAVHVLYPFPSDFMYSMMPL